jgi:hypothetical protein
MNIHNNRGVRLAFLDTQPTTQPTEDGVPHLLATSLHGYTLAHLARHLVCNKENLEQCAAQITTRLAMPFRRFDPERSSLNDIDPDRGGTIGTQGDLAKAITDEVNDWLADRLGPGMDPQQHLVLNLSLGWDPEQVDGLDDKQLAELKAGTQAVYDALQYAASFDDVLVVAAAGNAKTCSWTASGPLLPAAWEQKAPASGASRERPTGLIYAVGGVDSAGRKLSNARYRSMPLRTACGESAVVTTWGPEFTTWLYTGSSVATAVVSSTAAVVWDSFPNLTPAEVMSIVTKSGDALDFDADFGFTGTAPKSRRVSLCAALSHACKEKGSAAGCPVQEDQCPGWERQPTSFPDWVVQPIGAACHWWVVPQPDDPPCPPCNPRP